MTSKLAYELYLDWKGPASSSPSWVSALWSERRRPRCWQGGGTLLPRDRCGTTASCGALCPSSSWPWARGHASWVSMVCDSSSADWMTHSTGGKH